jgi:hypothetical protein
MGIGSGSGSGGIQEYNDQPEDYNRAYSAESYAFTAEQTRLKAVRQVPLKVWQTDAQGNRKAIDHPALAVLDQTNPYGYVSGIPALMSYTLWSLDFHGRNAWRYAFSRTRQPTEIYWQLPTTYTPLPDESKPMRTLGGIRMHNGQVIPAEELAYYATVNPSDPLLGLSKIKVLKDALNLRAYSQANNIAFFENSMRPDWILSGSWSNTQDNIDRIRRAIRRMLSGANNRAPLILGEGATAHLLTTSHEDAQWVEQMRLVQEEVSAAFGVPLVYLNNLERMTYDNVKTAKLILWHDTMIPECDELARFLDLQLLWRFWPGTREQHIAFGFDYDEIEGLGEDLALIWERAMKLLQQVDNQVRYHQITPNQSRALYAKVIADLGLDPSPYTGDIPGGDTFYLPFQNVPIDELSVQANMNIAAMRGQNPEFVESVPGAEAAGGNADDVADRLNKPPEPPQLPPGAPPPALPPGGGPQPQPPAPAAPKPAPEPQKAIDPAELRREVAAELRQDIEKAVGQAAVKAFGDALRARQPEPDHREVDQLRRRLKRYFQDQKTDCLRTIRQANGTLPADLYSRSVYRGRLADLVGDELADEVERETQKALRVAAAAGNPSSSVMALYQDAIDRRADEIAAGVVTRAYSPETELRDPEHMHDYGQNQKPVLSFDLHHTLTPDAGFPLASPPFPGVREFLNLMTARGCCVHISTASLDDTDPDVCKVRKYQIEDWAARYGLPIGYVCSNSHADVRVDDRALTVPRNPDWKAISAVAQAQLLNTYELDENGQYARRKDLTPVGEHRETWPKLSSVPADRPRGFSTPMIDIDVHRTLDPAWGTGRVPQSPDPLGVVVVRGLYGAGYQVQFSCAGWNPALDVDGGGEDRLAGIIQYLLTYDIPYDRVVSKDDYDLRFDDKAVPFTTWAEVRVAVLAAAGAPRPKGVSSRFGHAWPVDDAGQPPPFAKAAGEPPPVASRYLREPITRAEDHYASRVTAALHVGLDVERLAGDWLERQIDAKAVAKMAPGELVQVALAWLKSLGLTFSALTDVLRAIYRDGWTLGRETAQRAAEARGFDIPPPEFNINWSAWQPGSEAGAEQALGLQELLQQAGITIQGVNDTTLEEIAARLATGVANGDSSATIANALAEFFDGSRAEALAVTELNRAMSAASLDTYMRNGIAAKSWIVWNPCPRCQQNAGAGVIPVDQSFPSGDQAPPAHPRCRCSLVPERFSS